MEKCPQCGSEIKTIPAGISKSTGKAYQAFKACSNRQCSWKPPKTPSNTNAPTNNQSVELLKEISQKLSDITKLLRIEKVGKLPHEEEPEVDVNTDDLNF